jgi:pimeloyl-ACP methyl ester carboxylesterase
MPKKSGHTAVLMHGGMSSSASMLRHIGRPLRRHFQIAAFDRRGHGRTGDTPAPFSYDDMALDTIAFLELLGRRCDLVGFSDGGNAALLTALRRPDLVRRLVLVGANYHHAGVVPAASELSDDTYFDEWAARFGESNPDGPEYARTAFSKGESLFTREPTLRISDLNGVTVPTLVMSGDDDLISLAHTCSLYEAIPDAQLAIVPGSSHLVLSERTKEAGRIIRRFLTMDLPPHTYLPVRRRST